jgi:hypothetical protein
MSRHGETANGAGAMEYARYAAEVRFDLLQPDVYPPLEEFVTLTSTLLDRGTFVDLVNTVLPENDEAMKQRLAPRMSTFAVGALLNRAVAEMEPRYAFLNIGVWHGFTLLAGMAGNPDKLCIGVDNFSQFDGPREAFYERFRAIAGGAHRFHEMDYREYFARIHREALGVYLYDGDHRYDHQLEGLRVAEPHFGPNCLVFVDDTNEVEPRQATLDFVAQSAHAYTTLLDVRTCSNGHPSWWNGLMILRRTG